MPSIDFDHLADHLPHRPRKRHYLRWAFLIGVALAAIFWKQQTAISNGTAKKRDGKGDEPEGDASAVTPTAPRQDAEAPAHHTLPAGEDSDGVFRPERVEADEFGVVVTDDAPAGLSADIGWLAGDGSNECPGSHPIKGNASSRIYHLPGESSYEKTRPEICFATEDDAKAAGYRPRAR